MSQSLAEVYLHIIFSTKNRLAMIDDDISDELHQYIGGICNALGCQVICVGGYSDHIHSLCMLSKKIAIMKLLEEVKKSSSKWMKTKGTRYESFFWQDGYAAFSVSKPEIATITHYIQNQKARHQSQGFMDECRMLFKRYNVAFDERYVWD